MSHIIILRSACKQFHKDSLDLQKRNNLSCANSSTDVAGNSTALSTVRREVLSSPESRKESPPKSTENLVTFVPISSIKTEDDEEQTTMQKNRTNLVDGFAHLYKVSWDSFSCDKCKMNFPTENMLNRHKLSHNMNSWLRKDQLRDKYIHRLKTSLKKLSRQSKVQQQLEKYEYVCSLCGFGCNRRVTLTMHARKNHKTSEAKVASQKVACSICGSKCTSLDALNKHINDKHTNPVTKYLCCEKCNFECKRNSTLASHMTKRHPNESENVELSPKKRSRSPKTNVNPKKENIDRTSHQLASESEKMANENTEDQNEDVTAAANTVSKKQGRKPVEEQCNMCDFKCSAKSTMHSHKRQHKAESINEVYSCNECGFKTSKKSSLYSHIKRKHRVVKTSTGETVPQYFYCNQCEYKNKNKYELKVHVLRKHTDDFKFSCETCGKKFKVKGDLTNHIRFTHKEQPVICDVCGKTCLNSNSLYVHQKFAHYKAKYECPVCKRRMVSQENLNEHMLRQHERRENVVCEECGKTFSRNSRLKVHMRIHTGDKPYTCTICNKSFARRTALKQHLLIHTGIRPYVCDICGKAFTQKPGLISHRKSHPGTHPPLPRVLIDHILNDVMNN